MFGFTLLKISLIGKVIDYRGISPGYLKALFLKFTISLGSVHQLPFACKHSLKSNNKLFFFFPLVLLGGEKKKKKDELLFQCIFHP